MENTSYRFKTIISGFPGTGKSTATISRSDVVDLESSNYSWLYHLDELDNIVRERNPEFPGNYVEEVKRLIADDSVSIILVSSHEEVRKALTDAGISYIVVLPKIKCKNEYLRRYLKRGSPQSFIELLNDNFVKWIRDIKDNETHTLIWLDDKETLETILPEPEYLPHT